MTALSFPAGIRPYRAGDTGYAQYMTAFERNFSTDSTDSFASDDTDCDADSCDSSEEDF